MKINGEVPVLIPKTYGLPWCQEDPNYVPFEQIERLKSELN
ncbi:hypothetical protein LEP1GSC127_2703 [Leptospira kirschneri str. 200801925]|uniref:Uncharacterized protein n=1 Tax=Leptospira kirschneri str. 200802841 TaxID=1193047 RepID=A0A828XY21_9LEPT|nr:hypothetical protein [Leptospira kirschneri]EKO50279.1 hypothetical protein LEP1GSC131_2768 [Leptospira kirschneri str. 200802841]EKQ82088.1 hypothetical protein LEP1GSC064_4137 [Leptospira kirschneri serovar Grippotyphosa str. Moskva]EKR06977.1 hypothetical protein LEP1GSC122_3661 [Leptospira kirschneri serovar Valbuzzi str. 200702274]EMK01276.1 hypothetical protein LEP1GSC176_1223 [Leptospira kirschneri str. MMD1493]EMK13662.1 hypothetical protein LEP1GSC042_0582 [Leptospira kirschneri se